MHERVRFKIMRPASRCDRLRKCGNGLKEYIKCGAPKQSTCLPSGRKCMHFVGKVFGELS